MTISRAALSAVLLTALMGCPASGGEAAKGEADKATEGEDTAADEQPTKRIDRAPALRRELARLTDLSDRTERLRQRVRRLEPRVQRIRKVGRVSDGRTKVADAVASLAVREDLGDFDFERVEAFVTRWHTIVRVKEEIVLDEVRRAMAISLDIPDVPMDPNVPEKTTLHRLEFTFPQPAPVFAPGGPSLEHTPSAEKALELEIAALNQTASMESFLEVRKHLAMLEQDEILVGSRHIKHGERRSRALLKACATDAGLENVTADPMKRVRHIGIPAKRHVLHATGKLQPIAKAIACVTDTGVMLGKMVIQRVGRRSKARFELRVELHDLVP